MASEDCMVLQEDPESGGRDLQGTAASSSASIWTGIDRESLSDGQNVIGEDSNGQVDPSSYESRPTIPTTTTDTTTRGLSDFDSSSFANPPLASSSISQVPHDSNVLFTSSTATHRNPGDSSSTSRMGEEEEEEQQLQQISLSSTDIEPSELPYAVRTPPTLSSVKDEHRKDQEGEEIQGGETQLFFSKGEDSVASKVQEASRKDDGQEERSLESIPLRQQQEKLQQEKSVKPNLLDFKDGNVKPDESPSPLFQVLNNGFPSCPASALSSTLSSPSHQPPSMMRSSSTSTTSSQASSPNLQSGILPPPALSIDKRGEGLPSNQVEGLGALASSTSTSNSTSSPVQSASNSILKTLKAEVDSPTASNSSVTPTTPSSRGPPFSPSPLSPTNSSTQAHAHSSQVQSASSNPSTYSNSAQSLTISPHPILTFTSATSSSSNNSSLTRPSLGRRSASSASSSNTSPASAFSTTPLSPAPSTSSNGKEKEKERDREVNSIHSHQSSTSSSSGTPTSQSAGGRSPSAISGATGFFANFRSNSPKVSTRHEKNEERENKFEKEAASEKEKRNRSSSTSSSVISISQEQSQSQNHTHSNFHPFSSNKSSRESSSNGSAFNNYQSTPLIGPVPRETSKDSKEKAQEKERNRRSSSVFEHVGSWIGKKVHSRSESRGSDVSSSASFGTGVSSGGGMGSRRTSMLNPGKDLDGIVKSNSGADRDRSGFGFWSSASSSSLALSGSALDVAEEGEEADDGLSLQPYSSASVNSARSTPTLSHATPATLSPSTLGSSSNSSFKTRPGHSSHRSIDEIEELCSPIEPRPNARRQFSGGGVSGRRDVSHSRRISVLERVLIQVTEDNERFSVVDVSGLSTAEAIKERMFSKLHLYDELHSSCRLFRTEIGLSEVTSPTVDDDELLALCMQIGDDKGNLKFLVQQSLTSPPAHGSHGMAPPPPISATSSTSPSPRKRIKDLPFQNHGKSDSLSSSSSIGGALGLAGRHGDIDESSDGHSRGASTLQRRSKAQRRPGTAGHSIAGSSPVESQHAFSEQFDRRESDSPLSTQEILASPIDARSSATGLPYYKSSSATSPPASAGINSSDATSSPPSGNRPLGRASISQAASSSSSFTTGNNSGSQGWNEAASSSGRPAMQRNAPHAFEEDRNDAASHERERSEESRTSRNDNLSPQSRQSAPNVPHQSNRLSFSSSGSVESPSIHNARSLEDMRRLSDGIGSNSSTRRPSSGSQQQEVFAVHPLDQKDGRYPAASVSRGSGSTGSSSYQTLPSSLVPGPSNPTSGSGIPAPHSLGSQILRQSSADSHLHRGIAGPPPPALPQSIHDPRMVASPASMGGRSLQSPPMRYANSSNPETYQGNNQVPLYGPRPDPGVYIHQSSDPRFNSYARPPLARPMPAQGGSFGYGHSQSFYDPHAGPPPQSSPRPQPMLYTNEFGARVNPMIGVRPISNNGFGAPFPSRPHTYHDGPSPQQKINYRPPPPLQPHPQQLIYQQQPQQPQHPYHHMQQQQGGMKIHVPPQDREDPFTSAMFPASSSRQVSQFQRAGVASLTPGMTVQESLSSRQNLQPVQSQPGAHPFGPRDPRDQVRRPQSDYERYERTPLAGARPETNSRPQVQSASQPSQAHYYNHSHPPHSSPSNLQSFDQQQQQQRNGQRIVQEAAIQAQTHASGRSSGSSFASSSSHRRNYSNEDKSVLSSTEESAGSAPTSARSSRSGPISPDGTRRTETKASPAPNHHQQQQQQQASQEDDSKEDLEDIDLLNIRPLPRPPQQSGSPSTPRMDAIGSQKSNDDSTVNPHWGALYHALSNDSGSAQGGTSLTTSSGGDTLRAAPRSDSVVNPGDADVAVTGLSSRTEYDVEEPNDGGTFASFQSFDDEDDETGTWAQPLQPDLSTASSAKDKSSDNDMNSERTLGPGDAISLQDPGVTIGPGTRLLPTSPRSPRRPELRLTIDTPNGTKSLSRASSPTLKAGLSSTTSKFAVPAPSPGINRRTSFARRESDWAFRPPPEQLYENLDDFFPKHDLDKPVLDATAALGSPLPGSPKPEDSSPNQQIQPLSAASSGPGPFSSRTRHKKSIRIVAQDRKKFLERAEQAENRRAQGASQGGGLARRRSTKLWGSKVLEMTPGQDQLTPSSSVNDSPSSDSGARPVFKWVKGDLIGKGTYGRVYLALNATTGEMIAVKQVELPRTAHDREDIRQKGVVAALKSEIETLKDLDHPHIVSYLGFEETPEFLSIFLEYVPGGSVGSCLRKHGKFEEPTIQSFLHQILEGLEYLHARGILHRDLKADNILVDFTGTCKISDFGTVRRSDDIYGNVENMSLQGSIFWMAPEVVSLSKKGYSAKVDIWSIGCVVLEMFAGRRPWSDDEAVQAMFKIGAERRAPPIPPDVHLTPLSAHFLKQCFAIEPSERPTAARLLEHRFPYPPPDWRFTKSSLSRAIRR